MAQPIVMPSFGMYTSEGTLAAWLFPDGANVQIGDAIAEIETEKATNEIPAPASGVLRHTAAVGTLLKEEGVFGYILAEGELDVPAVMDAASRADLIESAEAVAKAGLPAGAVAKASPTGSNWIKASPLARRLAKDHGIDIATIRPTGPGGRIVKADVLAANAGASSIRSRIRLSSMRQTIGDRLKRAQATAASLTLVREVDADVLVAARERGQTRWPRLSFDALFVKLLAAALDGHPLNGVIDENDHALVQFEDVHVGFAVSVPDGLLVPVVKHANRSPLGDIEARIRDAAARARSNGLTSDDLAGGTATISNLGGAGIDAFTPILNPPQSCILGIGRIVQKPVVRNGNLTVGRTCVLSLTFDHRVCDGVPAAQVLDRIASLMNDDEQLQVLMQ
jgi:pyruvate/2-oxoglutarate dehydrogenase complex dihydrolipoamide acyltransferase (E2) component